MKPNTKIVIIGAGPTGLTLAHYLSKMTQAQITVIDRESTIGGCHRVKRISRPALRFTSSGRLFQDRTVVGAFTEHGPRIYGDNYLNFFRILQQDLNLNPTEVFVPYKFSITNLGSKTLWSHLSIRELSLLAGQFLYMTFISIEPSKSESVLEFVRRWNFAPASIDYLDRICRLSDGADIGRYTLFELLQTVDQHALYGIRQPSAPNDRLLFPRWQRHLENQGVVFLLGNAVKRIYADYSKNYAMGRVTGVQLAQGQIVSADLILLAMPPVQVDRLIRNSDMVAPFIDPRQVSFSNASICSDYRLFMRDATRADRPVVSLHPRLRDEMHQNFSRWAQASNYIRYAPVSFHYRQKLDITDWGFSESDWGVVWVVVSDYWNYGIIPNSAGSAEPYQTVISAAITRVYARSEVTGLTAMQSNQEELIWETFRQLPLRLPTPDLALMGDLSDTAFVMTPQGPWSAFSDFYDNLLTVGTHNGNSALNFTTCESAVSNALAMIHHLVPASKLAVPLLRPVHLSSIVYVVLCALGIWMLWCIQKQFN